MVNGTESFLPPYKRGVKREREMRVETSPSFTCQALELNQDISRVERVLSGSGDSGVLIQERILLLFGMKTEYKKIVLQSYMVRQSKTNEHRGTPV